MEENLNNAQEQELESQEIPQEEVQQEQQEAPKVLKIAVSTKRTRKLVESLDEMSGEYNVDGIAVITPETAFIIALSEGQYPYGGGSPDLPENDATTSNGDLDGEQRTDYLIALMELGEGTACVEAKKQGWLPSVGEWRIIKDHLGEINEKMEEVGGTPVSGEYWTSSLFSDEYAWHMDTGKGTRMYRGMATALGVRSIFSTEGYKEK